MVLLSTDMNSRCSETTHSSAVNRNMETHTLAHTNISMHANINTHTGVYYVLGENPGAETSQKQCTHFH